MKTRVTALLGIEYPIIQGGMAWVAEHNLAAAVSEAGGLGLIGGANAPGEVVREEIRKARELTDKPFGVNVMLMSPFADDVAKVVVEEGIKVVTTGAGNPGKYMEMWKNAGIKVIPVVASVALARMMERAEPDAVVAEGTESGGHIGDQTTDEPGPPGCGRRFHTGNCSRRNRRRKRNCSRFHAGSRGSSDGDPLCSGEGVHCTSELQRQNYQGERHRFRGNGTQPRPSHQKSEESDDERISQDGAGRQTV